MTPDRQPRDLEADQLDLELDDDADGTGNYTAASGAVISLALGWKGGAAVLKRWLPLAK